MAAVLTAAVVAVALARTVVFGRFILNRLTVKSYFIVLCVPFVIH